MIKRVIFFFSLILLLVSYPGFSQAIPDLIKLPHPDSLVNYDFKKLKPLLAGKRLVLAGEASHGGREFFIVKKALFKYLVEEHNFQHFALEENIAICEKFNAYISGKLNEDPKDLAKQAYYTWPYQTEEFSELLLWMREYNKSKPVGKMIKFWGIDMQFSYQSLQILAEKLNKLDKKNRIIVPDIPLQQHFAFKASDATISQISTLIKILDDNHLEKENLIQHLDVIKMKNIYSSKQRNGLYPTEASSRYRDSCMAANVAWIFSRIEKNEKLMVWAHNAHIAKNFSITYKAPMGAFLNAKYKDDSYHIGFDYNEGELLFNHGSKGFKPVYISPREEQYLARLLEKVNYNLIFIPFTHPNQKIFPNPIKMRQEHTLVEGAYANLYDAIFFVNRVSATTRIE